MRITGPGCVADGALMTSSNVCAWRPGLWVLAIRSRAEVFAPELLLLLSPRPLVWALPLPLAVLDPDIVPVGS